MLEALRALGWKENLENIRNFDRLPAAAQKYVKHLEKLAGAPIKYIGLVRARDAMIEVKS